MQLLYKCYNFNFPIYTQLNSTGFSLGLVISLSPPDKWLLINGTGKANKMVASKTAISFSPAM